MTIAEIHDFEEGWSQHGRTVRVINPGKDAFIEIHGLFDPGDLELISDFAFRVREEGVNG